MFVASLASAHAPVVYIAGFTDAGDSLASEHYEIAVRDLLVGALTESPGVRLVERERLEMLLREQQLTLQGLADPANCARLGVLLGADRIITGRLLMQGEELTLLAQVTDVATAVIQASCRASGRMADLLEVVVMLAGEISRALDIPFDPGVIDQIDLRPVCSLNYLRGLGFFHVGEYDRALMDFMISGDLDPDNYERHFWMAKAYMALEEYEHALIELWRFTNALPPGLSNRDASALSAFCRNKLDAAAGKSEE
ncbi:MAG: hypothetical protein LC725_02440 [Lentisphaerae bacterium]|nr:hypothetical protein [Lentisphaerota bacterium]